MDHLQAYLPQGKGLLPYYMFGLSMLAVGNSVQNYLTMHYSRRLYPGQFIRNPSLPAKSATFDPEDSTNKLIPAPKDGKLSVKTTDQLTPLAGRLFATYTFIAAVVRIYASYHLDLEPVYMMAMWTYIVAFGHFVSEMLVFKTFPLGKPQALPLFFATTGIAWMVSQKDFYVQA